MASPESEHSLHNPGSAKLAGPGPLHIFTLPNCGSLIPIADGYESASSSDPLEQDSNDLRLMMEYTGIFLARDQLVTKAYGVFEQESRADPEKRLRVMDEKFQLGFNTFCLAVINANTYENPGPDDIIPKNIDSLRALKKALRFKEDQNPSFYELPDESIEHIFGRSEREFRPAYYPKPHLVIKDYREKTDVPRYRATYPRRMRLNLDRLGSDEKTKGALPGLKPLCSKLLQIASLDTGGNSLGRSNAMIGGSDAWEAFGLGGVAAKNVILEIALEEESRRHQYNQEQKDQRRAA